MLQVFMHFLIIFGSSHWSFHFLHCFDLSLHSPSHASQVLGHFLVIFGSSHLSFHLLHFGDLSLHLPSPPLSSSHLSQVSLHFFPGALSHLPASRMALHLSSDKSSLHSPSPLSGPPSSSHASQVL